MPSPRRFPPPWSVEEPPACFLAGLFYGYSELQVRNHAASLRCQLGAKLHAE